MAEPLAIWGAITGTIGAGIAIRREILTGRRRLDVGVGVHLDVPFGRAPRATTQAWLYVSCLNAGRRPVIVERVALAWYGASRRTGEVPVEPALELAVEAPSCRIYTPLGPLLAAGLTLSSPVSAVVTITGGQEFDTKVQSLAERLPPGAGPWDLTEALERLEQTADQPEVPDRSSMYEATYALQRGEPGSPAL